MSRQTSQPADEQDQLAAYRSAVLALGGVSEHARLLGMAQAHGSRMFSGQRPISAAVLEQTGRALIARADLCRQLERQLTPAFVGNLTERQQSAPRVGRKIGSSNG